MENLVDERRHAGHVIKERLDTIGRTMYWLAGQCGVTPTAARLWVNTGKISRKNLPAISTALGLNVEALLAGKEGELKESLAPMPMTAPNQEPQMHLLTPEEFAFINIFRQTSEVARSFIRQTFAQAATQVKK